MKALKLLTTKQKLSCLITIIIAVIGACMASVWPVLLSGIYEDITYGSINSIKTGLKDFVIFGAVFLIAELCNIIRRVLVDKIATSYEKHLRDLSVKKLLKLPTKFFNSNVSGEYTAKINQSVSGSSQLLKVICNNVVPSVLIGTFMIIQVLRKAPYSIAIIMFTYIIVELFVSIRQIISQNGIRETLIQKKAKLDGTICQSIQNLQVIRVLHAEDYEFNRFFPFTENIRKAESKHHSYMGTFDSIKQVVKVLYTIILLVFAIYLVSKNTISAGMVITIILLFQQLVVPIDAIHVFIDEVATSTVKSKELIKMLDQSDDDIFSDKLTNEIGSNSDIVISNLTVYTPDYKHTVCNNISLCFESNTVIGLIGSTGCGKSSLLKAIMRFYPYTGEITTGIYDWDTLSQTSICDNIFYMTQDSMFFEGILKDNLIYGLNYNPTDEQLVFALKNACIYDELKSKTGNPLELSVSENANNFSGGQKQRIAIARAFLRQPYWFFMDESTSNLDCNTTSKVLDNLEHYANSIGAGIVYISHQPEVITRCDKIKKLEKMAERAA